MKHLCPEQRAYVIRCFASRLSLPQTVDYFICMYPDFGAHISEETRKKRLYERFKKIKQKHADEILALSEKDPDAWWHLPLTHRHVRIRELQKLLAELPTRELVRVATDRNGKAKKIYRSHVSLKRRILQQIRQETENL